MSDGLEPTTPAEAVEWYLAERDPELSEKSLQNQNYRLSQFVEFCEEHAIDDMNTLTGRDIHRYRVWRSEDIKPVTLQGELQTFRVFLEFCASIDAVEQGLREKVVLPDIDAADESKNVKLDEERAERVLDFLDQFRYASRDHVITAILWHTGIRIGTLRALDVDDWDNDALLLQVRHRPDTDSPLKNGAAANRSIVVGEYFADVIDDYIQYNREAVDDEYGRSPLVTTRNGRIATGTIRETIYRVTRPCIVGQECPHDRDESECEALEPYQASGCPSSRSPHAIRRGAITRMLREGVPEEVVSDRSNATPDVLEQHYDERSERERAELRREFLEDT
jgi:site-specific recombinase XerD